MKRQVPELRHAARRRAAVGAVRRFPEHDGLEVRPYVHNLFEHLACADLALVQGGLSTCMELVATRRPLPELSARAAFRAVHPRAPPAAQLLRRLRGAFQELTTDELAQRALRAMHAPVAYRPVETDGAARAAREIVSVMENRSWATG